MIDDLRPVSVAYDTRLEDYLALYRLALAARHPRYRQVTWVLLVLASAGTVASIALLDLPALAAALVAVVLSALPLRTPERLAGRWWRRDGSVRYEVRFDPTGYRGSMAGRSMAVAWPAVEMLALRSEHLYLGAEDFDAVIALRALPPEWTPRTLCDACIRWRAAATV